MFTSAFFAAYTCSWTIQHCSRLVDALFNLADILYSQHNNVRDAMIY